jgi:hypothetical protein
MVLEIKWPNGGGNWHVQLASVLECFIPGVGGLRDDNEPR